MERKKLHNHKELYAEINTITSVGRKLIPYLENCEILFYVTLPLDGKRFQINQEGIFNGLYINNCSFPQEFAFNSNDHLIYFERCEFTSIDFDDVIFKNKIRFHHCVFNNNLILNNTTFQNLIDFWSSEFKGTTIFYKVNFESTTVFSSVIFRENILFTFTTVLKLIVFKGTVFEKGVDLTTAIIEGKLSLFNIKLDNFQTKHISQKTNNDSSVNWLDTYDGYITDLGIIPTINKRETYRVLKEEFERLKNIPESLRYKVLEHRVYRDLLGSKKKNTHEFFDWLNLWLNDLSSFYGTSYARAFVFTLSIGWLFFYLSIMNTGLYNFSFNPIKWEFTEGLKYFVQFLIPTHKFNYLGDNIDLKTGFYLFDFFGRLLVGYGIYQFIQAFRKYK